MIVKRYLTNARLLGHTGLHCLCIDGGINSGDRPSWIESIGPATEAPAKAVDLEGDWLSLGGIDLQINGALGLAFPELQNNSEQTEQLEAICQLLWEQGVDGFLPTIVTSAIAPTQWALATIANFAQQDYAGAQILGVHLEGPFLNPQKRGAHPAQHLQPLSLERVKAVLGDYASLVKVITLAPELDTTGQVIPYLRSLGITVSLGHSLATATEAQQAFGQGATMVTHAFNAMPPLHHREPGLLATAILDAQVYCGLIADGQHVDPLIVKLLFRASGSGQSVFLVSDALAPLGLGDGLYPWDERQIEVKQGTARLLDGTLAGTTLPLLAGVQNLVRWQVCTVDEAIALATDAPRKALGLKTNYLGQPAHLLRWRHDQSTKILTWERL